MNIKKKNILSSLLLAFKKNFFFSIFCPFFVAKTLDLDVIDANNMSTFHLNLKIYKDYKTSFQIVNHNDFIFFFNFTVGIVGNILWKTMQT